MSLRKSFFKPALLAVAVASAMSVQAETQTTTKVDKDNPEIEMIEVVGVATAGKDISIDQMELEKLQASDLADIFRNSPEITAGGGVAAGQKIYVRGIGEDLLNITVDGAEQAGAVFHHAGRVLIEPELLKRVDVEAGAGSATAGPGALGGALRFTTKDPVDLLQSDENFGATLRSSYEDNGSTNKNSATLYGAGGMFSAMANIVQMKQDNLEDGDGNEIVGSELDVNLGYFKLVADFNEENYLSLSHEKLEHEGESLFRPEWEPNRGNLLADQKGTRETTTLNYNFDPLDNDLINLSLNVYKTENFQRRGNVRSPIATETDGAVETTGATLQNISRVGDHELIYGLNYRDDTSSLKVVKGLAAAFGRSQETGSILGFFVQDIYAVTEQLTLSAGARYDDYEFKYGGIAAIPKVRPGVAGRTYNEDGTSVNVGANYQLNDAWGLSASYAEALRGPKVYDAFRVGTYDNALDLKAEEAENIELGVNYEQNGLAFSTSIYRSEIMDPLSLTHRGGSLPSLRENIDGKIVTDGYTVKLNYSADTWSAGAKFNSSEGEVESSDPTRDGLRATRYTYGSAAAVIGDTLVLNADYMPSDTLSIGWSAEIVGDVDEYKVKLGANTGTIKKSAYTVHDLYLRWQPLANDTLMVALNAKNIFDKAYRAHAGADDLIAQGPEYSGIAAPKSPGRNISLTATLRF